VAPGLQLVDTPEFPAAYKDVALAHRDALSIYQAANDLDWPSIRRRRRSARAKNAAAIGRRRRFRRCARQERDQLPDYAPMPSWMRSSTRNIHGRWRLQPTLDYLLMS
jgi:hypothetical protein